VLGLSPSLFHHANEERRAIAIKRALVLVILISLMALLVFISGCMPAGAQTRESYTYSSEIYDASKVSPTTEQEVLDFLVQDTTDENLWREGVYECGHFSADVWWDAYMQGLEACMVWVKHMKWGEEQVHWVVKFHVGNETQDYWLWVEPSSDEVVDEDDYTIQDTFCGEEAYNVCKTWWEESSS
jgi:hypothetical protein